MMMPKNQWMEVIEYRDFYDLPRLLLAKDQCSVFWILDCAFDDDIDDYQDSYSVYLAGHDLVQAKECFEQHSLGTRGEALGAVLVSRLQFDPTKRKAVLFNG